jgi:hypothetical protein
MADSLATYKEIFEERFSLWQERYQEFRKHILTPSAEFFDQKGKMLGIDLEKHARERLPIMACPRPGISNHYRKPLLIGPDMDIELDHPMRPVAVIGTDPDSICPQIDISKYTITVKTKSIDHLKQLVGIPNEVHEISEKRKIPIEFINRFPIKKSDLPKENGFKYSTLKKESREAVRNMSMHIVHGHVDADMLKQMPYAPIAKYIMGKAKTMSCLVGSDLLICPGESVIFQGYPVLCFNNVIIVGDGQINIGNNAKLHAYQIKNI